MESRVWLVVNVARRAVMRFWTASVSDDSGSFEGSSSGSGSDIAWVRSAMSGRSVWVMRCFEYRSR